MPASEPDDSRAFTKSERILLDFQRMKRMNARDLKDLIQDVLKHSEFNADEVDHNMHERLMRAVEDGQMDILDCVRTAMVSKMSDSLNARWMWYCGSCWRTNGSRTASSTNSKSTRTPTGTASLGVMQTDLSLFKLHRREWVLARCLSPSCCISTPPSSSEGFLSVLYIVSSYVI